MGRPVARAGGRGRQGRSPRRGDRPGGGSGPPRRGGPHRGGRGHPARHDRRVARAPSDSAVVKDGTITAGNASQISDGAAAVVVTSRERAEREGLPILAAIVGHGMVAGPDASLPSQPSNAIRRAAARAGVDPGSFDLYEINEAFASVAIQSARELGVGDEKVNVNGGAVALGHPIGASGVRLALTLAYELRRRGGGVGAAALCGGGGQGEALFVRVEG